MWSYLDALRLIKEKGTPSLLPEKVNTICKTTSVYTLKQDNTLSEAFFNLNNLPFYPTHLPMTKTGGYTEERPTVVEGVIDEVLINTLPHDIFRKDLADMSISYITKPVNSKEIVTLDTTIGDLIEILITRHTKPTGILVGNYDQRKREFTMNGIVNYVDLFNYVLRWAQSN
jgi:hypothetical protein